MVHYRLIVPGARFPFPGAVEHGIRRRDEARQQALQVEETAARTFDRDAERPVERLPPMRKKPGP